jgi:hypothetical protein
MQKLFTVFKQHFFNWLVDAKDVEIGRFHKSNSPQVCNINDANNELKFIEKSDVSEYYVKSPSGYSPVKHSMKTVKYDIHEINLANGMTLKCADKHILMTGDRS